MAMAACSRPLGYLPLGATNKILVRIAVREFRPDLQDVKTVLELSIAYKLFDSNTEIKVHSDTTTHEANLLQLVRQSKTELGVKFNTHDAIRTTAEWYYGDGVSADTQTALQISEFSDCNRRPLMSPHENTGHGRIRISRRTYRGTLCHTAIPLQLAQDIRAPSPLGLETGAPLSTGTIKMHFDPSANPKRSYPRRWHECPRQ